MFHAAKALVLKRGYREKSHYCLIITLKELYVKPNVLKPAIVENLELCMHLRHDADYGAILSEESSETALGYAEVFLTETERILE